MVSRKHIRKQISALTRAQHSRSTRLDWTKPLGRGLHPHLPVRVKFTKATAEAAKAVARWFFIAIIGAGAIAAGEFANHALSLSSPIRLSSVPDTTAPSTPTHVRAWMPIDGVRLAWTEHTPTEIYASTNLTVWALYTNCPAEVTETIIPNDPAMPQRFYKIMTASSRALY